MSITLALTTLDGRPHMRHADNVPATHRCGQVPGVRAADPVRYRPHLPDRRARRPQWRSRCVRGDPGYSCATRAGAGRGALLAVHWGRVHYSVDTTEEGRRHAHT
jgi:hypothetical protein